MLDEAAADAYFDTRPRISRIGAWASQQSRPLESRALLEKAVEDYSAKFGDGEIPRPAYWRGYRLTPDEIEFWQDGEFRLHDRVAFHADGRTDGAGSGFIREAPRVAQVAACAIDRPTLSSRRGPNGVPPDPATPARTLLLTGASRGIGHATVKRFSSAGWRVITCSRHPFPENCPWMAGPQDHIQVDLADPDDTARAIARDRERLEGGRLDALVNNAAISPKGAGGTRLGLFETEFADWLQVFQVNFFAAVMLARGLSAELERAQGLDRQRHLDRRLARASVRRRRLCDLEGGARRADPRNGGRFRPARRARQRDLAGRDRHRDPVARAPRRSSRKSRCAGSARRDEVAKTIYFLCTEQSSYVNGAELLINGGQHV